MMCYPRGRNLLIKDLQILSKRNLEKYGNGQKYRRKDYLVGISDDNFNR